MGESIIEARIRRLREEGEALDRIPFGERQYQTKPRALNEKERDLVVMDIVQEVVVTKEVDGIVTASVEHETVTAPVDANAGPFENIAARGWLRRTDEEAGVYDIRLQTGLRYRSLVEGAQVSGLQAQSYEPRARGGAGKLASDHNIDCIKALQRLTDGVPEDALRAVDEVVARDVWIWEGKKDGAISKEVDRVLRGLDHLAIGFGYLTAEDVSARWPSPAKRRGRASSAAR